MSQRRAQAAMPQLQRLTPVREGMQPARERSRILKGPSKQQCAGCVWVVGHSIAMIQAGHTGQSQQHAKANQGRVRKLLPHTVIVVKQNLVGSAQATPQRLAMPVGTPGGECCAVALPFPTHRNTDHRRDIPNKKGIKGGDHLLAIALTNKSVCMWRWHAIIQAQSRTEPRVGLNHDFISVGLIL